MFLPWDLWQVQATWTTVPLDVHMIGFFTPLKSFFKFHLFSKTFLTTLMSCSQDQGLFCSLYSLKTNHSA